MSKEQQMKLIVRDDSELIRIDVQSLAVARFAGLERSRHVNLKEAALCLDQLADFGARREVGRNRAADGDAARTRDVGRNIADARNVEVAVLLWTGVGAEVKGRQ